LPSATLVPIFFLCFDVDWMAALDAVLNVFCKQHQACMHSSAFTSVSLKQTKGITALQFACCRNHNTLCDTVHMLHLVKWCLHLVM